MKFKFLIDKNTTRPLRFSIKLKRLKFNRELSLGLFELVVTFADANKREKPSSNDLLDTLLEATVDI